MKVYKIARINKFRSHVSIYLLPRRPSDRIDFQPGQYAALSINHGGNKTPVRCFSFTNIPQSNGLVEFAFRVIGNFTEKLANVSEDDEIYLQGPFGEFTLFSDIKNVVMIAGGIGITPMMSMLRGIHGYNNYVKQSSEHIKATLLYSVRSARDVPFGQELYQLSSDQDISVSLFADDSSQEQNRHSRINYQDLQIITSAQPNDTAYYICGPEPMMKSMSEYLIRLGVNQQDIITESFASTGAVRSSFLGMTPAKLTFASSAMALLLIAAVIGFNDIPAKIASQPSSENTTSIQTTKSVNDDNLYQDDTGSNASQDSTTTQNNSSTSASSSSSSSDSSGGSSSSPSASSTPQYNSSYTSPRSTVS